MLCTQGCGLLMLSCTALDTAEVGSHLFADQLQSIQFFQPPWVDRREIVQISITAQPPVQSDIRMAQQIASQYHKVLDFSCVDMNIS